MPEGVCRAGGEGGGGCVRQDKAMALSAQGRKRKLLSAHRFLEELGGKSWHWSYRYGAAIDVFRRIQRVF